MAFPSVVDSSSDDETNSTAPTYTYPTTVNNTNLALFLCVSDNVAAFTRPTGTEEIYNDQINPQFRAQVFAKIADGTEGDTSIDGTLASAESTNHICYVIQDWWGTIATGVSVSAGAFKVSPTSDVNPDPDSLSPSWGAADNLWISFMQADAYNGNPSVYPANYTLNQLSIAHSEAIGGRQAIGSACRQLNASSENPGTFTIPSTYSWGALTIAIRPAAVGGGTLHQTTNYQGMNRMNGAMR